MANSRVSKSLKILACSIVCLLALNHPRVKATQERETQAQVLSQTASGILDCSLHPCLEDAEEDVRKQLHNQIVNDDIADFSDLATAYPKAGRLMSGIVEWDQSSGLKMVSLKITRFREGATAEIAALQEALPGCEMEEDDDTDAPSEPQSDSGAEEGKDLTREWSCDAQGPHGQDVTIELFYAPGIQILEIGS